MTKSDAEYANKFLDVLIVGTGPAGVGVMHALLRAGLPASRMGMIERGGAVGQSLRDWHMTTRFISPSFPSYPFGAQDLNAVVPDTAVHASEHPSGRDYARYLQRMVSDSDVSVATHTEVVRVGRVPGSRCYPRASGHAPADPAADPGLFLVTSAGGNKVAARFVVWATGEWLHPNRPPVAQFPEDACVHYKHAKVDDLVKPLLDAPARRPVVLVGAGEAAADLAFALVRKGARRIVMVEREAEDGDPKGTSLKGPQLDPSRRLSPATEERMELIDHMLDVRYSTSVVRVDSTGEGNVVVLNDGDGKQSIISTPTRVVLCTGFDVSSDSLWNELFAFRDGKPRVNDFDESTRTRNLFLAGPMLLHTTTGSDDGDDDEDDAEKHQRRHDHDHGKEKTEDKAEGEGEGDSCSDENKIIFCFIYKFRTRFAVVAAEIMRRVVRAEFYDEEGKATESGEATLEQVKDMQALYKSRGMLLTDLSCQQLACGMTTCDAPLYTVKEIE